MARVPFQVVAGGPGNGDGQFFEYGRFIASDWGFLVPLLGFAPAPMLSVIAMCSSQVVDHVSNALLTAETMDIVGSVAIVELHDHQVEPVRALPGILIAVATSVDDSAVALSDGQFLRAFAADGGFSVVQVAAPCVCVLLIDDRTRLTDRLADPPDRRQRQLTGPTLDKEITICELSRELCG